jgi:hypothetical protein
MEALAIELGGKLHVPQGEGPMDRVDVRLARGHNRGHSLSELQNLGRTNLGSSDV